MLLSALASDIPAKKRLADTQDTDGNTALMLAVTHSSINIIQTICAHPDTDFSLTNNASDTALTIAEKAADEMF